MNAIFNRRSVRQYSDKEVSKDTLIQILKAGMQAPSAANGRPWEFIVVTNKDKLKELSNVHAYAKMIDGASFAIVMLGNEKKMTIPNKWEQDLGASAQNIMLEACDLGLGTVWLGVHPGEEPIKFLNNMFNLETHIKPYAIICGGYPKDENANKFVDRFDESAIHFEKY